MSPRVRVAVLSGGRSSEHEISVASARSVLESLDPERYEAVTVEIDREGKWQLESGRARALDPGAVGELDEGRAGRQSRRSRCRPKAFPPPSRMSTS